MRSVDKLLQDQATSGNGEEYDLGAASLNITFYITSHGTTSGGTLQLETSDIPGYAGTWAALGSVINASTTSGDKKGISQVVGVLRYVRARIASAITGGGSISVRVIANQ